MNIIILIIPIIPNFSKLSPISKVSSDIHISLELSETTHRMCQATTEISKSHYTVSRFHTYTYPLWLEISLSPHFLLYPKSAPPLVDMFNIVCHSSSLSSFLLP